MPRTYWVIGDPINDVDLMLHHDDKMYLVSVKVLNCKWITPLFILITTIGTIICRIYIDISLDDCFISFSSFLTIIVLINYPTLLSIIRRNDMKYRRKYEYGGLSLQ